MMDSTSLGYEVDFLPVGEGRSGDAIALRLGNLHGPRAEQTVIVIDGGFTDSGEALVQHVRTHYGTNRVDLVISTHPDMDHATGLEALLESCDVRALWMHLPWNHTADIARMFHDGRVSDASVSDSLRKSLDSARSLERLAARKCVPITEPFTGLTDSSQQVIVLGPSVQFYEGLLPDFRCTPEPKQAMSLLAKALLAAEGVISTVAEHWNFETLDDSGETSAENNSSVITLVRVGAHQLLFTGDAGIPALTAVADVLAAAGIDISTINFIQVPHHGSRRNVGPTILDRLVGPRLASDVSTRTAFVSAAADGAPKHPSKKVTNAFRRRGVGVHATAGASKRHAKNAPQRPGWVDSVPIPFFSTVDE